MTGARLGGPAGSGRLTRVAVNRLVLLGAWLLAILAVAAAVMGAGQVGMLLALAAVAQLLWLAGRATPLDVTNFLVVVAVLMLLVPARLVFASLGGAGTPAAVLALVGGWFWVLGRAVPRMGAQPRWNPVRYAVFAYLAAAVASYVVAATRALDPVEARAADRGLFIAFSAAFIALLPADGIRRRERLDALLKAVVIAGAGLAVVGILQFAWGFDLSAMVRLPGLTEEGSAFEAITTRSRFRRVAGMTFHPIEFSAVLTMLLPFALHYAYDNPPGRRTGWWLAAGLMAGAIPMSVSRTGTVGILVIGLVMVPSWSGTRRRHALIGSAVFAVLMKALIPGLLGTLRALFLSFGVDPSVTNRQVDYSYVTRFIDERPLLGRGLNTFLPERYDYLDNQFLLSLVETGVVGLAALVGVFVVAIACGRGLRRRTADGSTRDLAQSLVASLGVVLVTCGTYDFLSFPTARGLAFLLVGITGALWCIERDRRAASERSDADEAPPREPGRGDLVAAGAGT